MLELQAPTTKRMLDCTVVCVTTVVTHTTVWWMVESFDGVSP